MDSNDLWQINQQKIIAEKLTNIPEWIQQSSWEEFILAMNLKNPQVIGFGISDKETFKQATAYAKGALIGSAFIKHITEKGKGKISDFIRAIL